MGLLLNNDVLYRTLVKKEKVFDCFIDDFGRDCLVCGRYKLWDNFYKDSSMVTGHISTCKDCSKLRGMINRKFGCKEEISMSVFLKVKKEYESFERDKNGQIVVDGNCELCGKAFRGVKHRKFCSQECSLEGNKIRNGVDRWVIFNRDGCTCIYCGKKTNEVEMTIEHVKALSYGGSDTASNLVTCCKDCNGARHRQDLTKETLEYILGEIDFRNKKCGINENQIIKGCHTSEKRKNR